MTRVGRRGLTAVMPPHRAARLRRRFAREHFLRLPGFLERDLLATLAPAIAKAPAKRVRDAGGSESEVADSPYTAALIFLLGSPGVLAEIRRLTGLKAVRKFVGRAYRLLPSRRDAMGWHNDVLQKRKLIFTLNLSQKKYRGGTLVLRRADRRGRARRLPNLGFGSALLVRVSSRLEHCVTPVRGRAPKIAFAGWFTA